jgi:hypothetical protein
MLLIFPFRLVLVLVSTDDVHPIMLLLFGHWTFWLPKAKRSWYHDIDCVIVGCCGGVI